MTVRSVYAPTLNEISRGVRSLEERLQQAGNRLPVAEQERFGEVFASALNGVAARLRGSAHSWAEDAATYGSEAAKLGNDAWRRVSREVEHRPLLTIAAALGLGMLIGLVALRRAR